MTELVVKASIADVTVTGTDQSDIKIDYTEDRSVNYNIKQEGSRLIMQSKGQWFGGSAMIAQSLENFAATQPRDIRESVCRNGMCFWPEHTEEQIAANSAAYDQIRATMPVLISII